MRTQFYSIFTAIFLILFLGAHLQAQVTGKVFRDFNANGIQTTAAPDPIEPGLKDVTVNAYDNAGVLNSAISDAAGNYSIAGGTGSYRVEFILPPFSFASNGSASNTTVQFVAVGGTADLGVNYLGDYCQANPPIVIPNHDAGSGVGNARIGFGTLHYDDSGKQIQYGGTTTNMTNDATVNQIGTVWGVAYQKKQKRVFTSAFLKRYAAFADGPGFIYVLDYTSGTSGSIVKSFDLQGVATASGGTIDLGSINRTNTTGAISAGGAAGDYQLSNDRFEPTVDLDAFAKVSKMSFGDADLTEDEKTLWMVNLFQKSLIKVDVSNSVATALPGAVDQILLSSLSGYPSATTGAMRPWGLKFYKGKGYLGVVNDASLGSRADLKAYVLSFDPNNITAGFINELEFSLDFNRGNPNDRWKPWISTWAETTNNNDDFKLMDQGGVWIYPQPILTDIEFQANGDMLIGFRDRLGDQTGQAYKPISGSRNPAYTYTRGDLLKACKTSTGFTIEGGSGCAVNYTGVYGVSGTGEFFQDAIGDGALEGFSGGLAILPGTNEIVSTILDPKPTSQPGYDNATVSSQGIHWNNLTSGAQTDWYQIEPQNNGGTSVSRWGKANGIGDIELLCNSQPIEIGNRIFMDTNSDGIQDPNEMGLDGVTVKLYKAGTEVGSTTTANGGQWFFSNLDADTNYEIKVLAASFPAGKSITTSNTASNAKDMIDSDASLVGTDAVIAYKTGTAGQNNHTLDFGFKTACLLASTAVTSNPTCANNNGGINLTVTGATGTPTYLWSNAATSEDLSAISAGDYTVTVTDGACTTVATYSVSVTPANQVTAMCIGESYQLMIQDNTLTGIQWKKNGTDIAGANALTYTATEVGVYTYTSNGVGGCAVGQCCPIELTLNPSCCKPKVCTTVKITRH